MPLGTATGPGGQPFDLPQSSGGMTVTAAQRADAPWTKETLAAGTAKTVLPANATTTGARILNWIAAPVFIGKGAGVTPVSTAPSDYVPAASGGVPGQWECSYAPTEGLSALCASAGDLTVILF